MAKDAPAEAPKTKLAKALDFKQRYETLISEAKEEALQTINEQIAELAKIGFRYRLVTEEELAAAPVKRGRPKGEAKPKPAPGPSANYDEKKTCPICGGAKGHDGRAHRSQEPKKPFTKEELSAKGLLSPSA